MEEACARLREEIESLQLENQKLESIYLANGISRISKSCNDDQLTKWVDETLKNCSRKDSLSSESRTVYLLSKKLRQNSVPRCQNNPRKGGQQFVQALRLFGPGHIRRL